MNDILIMQKLTFKLLITFYLLGVSFMTNASCDPFYNHQFKTLSGELFDLCDYQNQPVLVVNTASKCGFTPQFEGLENLYEQYQSQGLLVIGFPSNDFRQELSEDKKIGDFCRMTYGVKFPMMAKSAVRGADVNPFYQQLIKTTGTTPKWNFYKYVITPNAKKVTVFSSLTKPSSKAIFKEIEPYLKE